MKWKKMDRNLKEGEINRTNRGGRITNPSSTDGYIYGRAAGGFGTSMNTIGSAIFVENEAWTYEECEHKKSYDKAIWERYWGIEIMEG